MNPLEPDWDWKRHVLRMPERKARVVVLLSGGMDSAIVYHLALEAYGRDNVIALFLDYGQPHMSEERAAARRIAEATPSRSFFQIQAPLLFPVSGILDAVLSHNPAAPGPSPAFVAGRNAVLLSVALSYGSFYWPGEPLILVLGATADDQEGFRDCRPTFLSFLGAAFTTGYQPTEVLAPLVGLTKTQALRFARGNERVWYAVQNSYSCYRGGQHACGTCGACVARGKAFAEQDFPELDKDDAGDDAVTSGA